MDYFRFIRRRTRNLGLTHRDSCSLASWYIQQLSLMNNEERAVAFFKAVGDAILHYLYGSPAWPEWVASKHGFPKTIYFLKKYDDDVLVRISKFARSVRLSQVTPKQVNKVVPPVISDYDGTSEGLERLTRLITSEAAKYKLSYDPSDVPPLGKVFRRTVSVSGVTQSTMSPPLKEGLDIVLRTPELYGLPYWKDVFHPLSYEYLEECFERYEGPEGHSVGKVFATQEGGGKLRMYAAPFSVVQQLLYPIHYWIDSVRRQLPTDCTYSQTSGCEWAQSKLMQGICVHSVDLSSATCRFPLVSQLEMLRVLGLKPEFVTALNWACTGVWEVSSSLELFPRTLQWKTGQPLGIAPSMSMFSLAHNLLLTALSHDSGVAPEDTFRVLGDDVVIANDDVHRAYLSIMSSAGVPISWHKCHSSSRVAEFAGATISSRGWLRPGQWREATVSNHIDLASELGTPLYGEVSERWLKVERLAMFIDGKYTPSPKDWNKYLKPASLISTIDFDIPRSISGLSWYTGVRREYVKQLCNSEYGYPEFGPDDRRPTQILLRGLGFSEHIRVARSTCEWYESLSEFHIDSMFISAWLAIQNELHTKMIDVPEYHRKVKLLVNNTRSMYYVVPKARHSPICYHAMLNQVVAV